MATKNPSIKDYLEQNTNKLTQNELMNYFIHEPSNKRGGGGERDKNNINDYFQNIKNYLSGENHTLDNAEIPSFDEQLLDYVKNAPKKTVLLKNRLLASKREREGPIDELIDQFEDMDINSKPLVKWNNDKENYDNVEKYETNYNKEEEIIINTNLKITRFLNTENIKESVYIFMVYIQRFIVGICYILRFIRSIPVFGNIIFGILLTSLYEKCFIFQIVCDLLLKGALSISDITGLTDVFYDVCYKILALSGSVASTYLPGIINNAFESYFATNIAQVISEQVATQVTTEVSKEVSTQIATQSFQITQYLMQHDNGIQLLIQLVEKQSNNHLTDIITNAITQTGITALTTTTATTLMNAIKQNIPTLAIGNGVASGGKPRRQTRRKIRRNKKAKTKKRKVNKKTKKRKMKRKTNMNRKKSKKTNKRINKK